MPGNRDMLKVSLKWNINSRDNYKFIAVQEVQSGFQNCLRMSKTITVQWMFVRPYLGGNNDTFLRWKYLVYGLSTFSCKQNIHSGYLRSAKLNLT